jgi:hypothetical protein
MHKKVLRQGLCVAVYQNSSAQRSHRHRLTNSSEAARPHLSRAAIFSKQAAKWVFNPITLPD